jgi:hypothetical protein
LNVTIDYGFGFSTKTMMSAMTFDACVYGGGDDATIYHSLTLNDSTNCCCGVSALTHRQQFPCPLLLFYPGLP